MFKIKLPQTPQEFDRLVKKFQKYADKETVVSILAQTIRYAAKEQMYVSRNQVIQSIQKIAANAVADQKLTELKINFLTEKYNQDASDPQVIKALQTLAAEGNEQAKELLSGPVPLRSV